MFTLIIVQFIHIKKIILAFAKVLEKTIALESNFHHVS